MPTPGRRASRIRVTIGSRPGASTARTSPVGFRLLNTAPARRVSADFLADLEFAKRGGVAARLVTQAKLRGRNGVFRDLHSILQHDHTLVRSADEHAVPGVLHASCEQRGESRTQKELFQAPTGFFGSEIELHCLIQKIKDFADT